MTDNRQQTYRILNRAVLPMLTLLTLLGIGYLINPLAKAFLLIFSGILFAVFLSGLARFLERKAHVPYRWGTVSVLVALASLIAVFVWLAGPSVNDQFDQLTQRLPKAIENVVDFLEQFVWARAFLDNASDGQSLPLSDMLGGVSGFFSFTTGVIVDFFVILFLGIYLAFSPSFYKNNLLRILPPSMRERAGQVLDAVAHGLGWWLVGRLSSMLAVGILVTIGLWLVGQPLAVILGIIAGLLSFIPYIGPVFSVLPAVLVALIEHFALVFWVLVVYGTAQFLESYLITPLIQKKAVSTPPALLISVQLLMAVLFGFYGVLLATPLTVSIIILIQMLYLEDVLGEPVRLLGEH